MILYLSMIQNYIRNKKLITSDITGEDISFHTFRIGPQHLEEPEILSIIAQPDGSTRFQCQNSFFIIFELNLEDACALTMDAYQFYNHWEKDLITSVWNTPDYQKLIDVSKEIFQNPIFITNWQGKILGYTKDYANVPIRDFWTQLVKDEILPISCLSNLRKSQYNHILGNENHATLLHFEDLNYRCILGLIHANHEIVLCFQIIEHNRALTETDVKLAHVFLAALQKAHRENQPVYQETASYLFTELLNGKTVEQKQLNWILYSLGWNTPGTNYYLIYFQSLNEFGSEQSLLPQIERHIPGSKTLYWNGHIIMLLSEHALKRFEKDILHINREFNMKCGVSLPFQDWEHLAIYFKQVKTILHYSGANNQIYYGLDYSWQYLLNSMKENAITMRFVHPAIQILLNYDSTNSTDFAKTLYTYLKCERNTTLTADELFIHRNTLQYRIRRIKDLIQVDLDNSDIRSHLMLSYLILNV